MTKIINNTEQTLDTITRIDGKWWDGLKPGETLESDNPYVIKALVKAGADIVGRKKKADKEKEAAKKEAVKKPRKPAKKKLEELPTPKVEYDKLTKPELIAAAKERGVSVRGSKIQIIDRLKNA